MLVESISTYNVSVYFVSLICLNLSGVDFGNTGMASFIVGILRASPNLRMLETSVSGMLCIKYIMGNGKNFCCITVIILYIHRLLLS